MGLLFNQSSIPTPIPRASPIMSAELRPMAIRSKGRGEGFSSPTRARVS